MGVFTDVGIGIDTGIDSAGRAVSDTVEGAVNTVAQPLRDFGDGFVCGVNNVRRDVGSGIEGFGNNISGVGRTIGGEQANDTGTNDVSAQLDSAFKSSNTNTIRINDMSAQLDSAFSAPTYDMDSTYSVSAPSTTYQINAPVKSNDMEMSC